MKTAAINVENLAISRGKREILHDVSFTVYSGDFVAVVGPNGAGKTTLLKCVSRILPITTGAVSILGQALTGYRRKELARHVSYLPQADYHTPSYTVREYVMMGRYPHLSPFVSVGKDDETAVQAAMERVAVVELQERRIDTLSGGERQKVFIAAALAQGAEILLLDEPGSFLDPKHQVEVYETLRQLNDGGITIVMVTHNLNCAALYSSAVLALKGKTIAFSGTQAEFIQPRILKAIFDIDFDIVPHPTTNQPIVVAGASYGQP